MHGDSVDFIAIGISRGPMQICKKCEHENYSNKNCHLIFKASD
jgi:hypothetical protein